MAQFLDVKCNTSLPELLVLVHQEPAVRILEEVIFADRLAFSLKSEACALRLQDGHRGMRNRVFSPATLKSCDFFEVA